MNNIVSKMSTPHILIIILIGLIIHELRTISYFTDTPTPYKLIGVKTRYALVNEDNVFMKQDQGKITFEFTSFQAPLGTWFVISGKKTNGGLTFPPMKVINITTDLPQLMTKNKLFLRENMPVQYYIRFLDDTSYAEEVKRIAQAANKKQQIENCIATHQGVNKSIVFDNCKI
jgi:hypothetical protein